MPTVAPVVRGRDDVHLSLSHAAGATVLAVAPFAIGIDIECVDPELDALAIDPELFGPRDYAFLQGQAEPTRLRHFYRLWTLKEARLKRFGRNLAERPLAGDRWTRGRHEHGLARARCQELLRERVLGRRLDLACAHAGAPLAAPSPDLASANCLYASSACAAYIAEGPAPM